MGTVSGVTSPAGFRQDAVGLSHASGNHGCPARRATAFQDPAQEDWWNNSCWRKGSWQLAALDTQVGRGAPTSNWKVRGDRGLARPAGYNWVVNAETVSELCDQGHLTEAVEALGILVQTDCYISPFFFYDVLKKCVVKKNLVLGRRVHAFTVRKGYGSDTFLCNHILRMYASHGRLQEAMDVLTVVSKADAFMWSSIISAHVKHGRDKQAIELYHRMRRSSMKPDGHVFVAALQACARGADLETGKQVHDDILASGVEPDLFVCNCLVDMYAKCGRLEEARRVFDGLGRKDVVTWTALIAGYTQQGMGQEALELYSAMQEESIAAPNAVTFVCLLQACAHEGATALEKGKQLHAQIRELRLQADAVVCCSLVNMYAKCGSLEDARRVFDGLCQKDVVTWTALIVGYSQEGRGQEALHLYSAMQECCITLPDSVTFASLLHSCASVGALALEKGKQLHAQIREQGRPLDVVVGCSLVNMYAKCGSLEDARVVFDGLGEKNVVTWTALIAGYAEQGMAQEALRLHSAMQEDGMAAPNAVTLACLLQACASVGTPALEKGKQLHAEIGQRGLQADVLVSNSLVHMYAKCGSLVDARRLFDLLLKKDVVTWTSLIAGYSQQDMGQEALHLYRTMQKEGILAADAVTFVCLLQACANVAALHLGRQLHAQIQELGLLSDMNVGNSLLNMYAKSGSMADAEQVFAALPERDHFAWNTLIAGYTRQGDSEAVFQLFHRMQEDDIQPASMTFICVLTACSHAGLVNKGREYFWVMSRQYGITPTTEHYTCMVDLLGRAGHLTEALALLSTMPALPDAVVWHTLLAACRKWNNVQIGRHAFDEAVKLDKGDAAAYVLMSNVYTGAQMWEQAQELHARRKAIRAWKLPGQSWWTDMDGLVHSFFSGTSGLVIEGHMQ